MARRRQAVELAMTGEDIETLTALSRSRTEAARRVERAQMLLAYRQQPSFFALGQRLGGSLLERTVRHAKDCLACQRYQPGFCLQRDRRLLARSRSP